MEHFTSWKPFLLPTISYNSCTASLTPLSFSFIFWTASTIFSFSFSPIIVCNGSFNSTFCTYWLSSIDDSAKIVFEWDSSYSLLSPASKKLLKHSETSKTVLFLILLTLMIEFWDILEIERSPNFDKEESKITYCSFFN